MGYASKVKPSESGPGTNRFLVADALLDCGAAKQDDKSYGTAVEHAMAIATPSIMRHKDTWEQLMKSVLVDPLTGEPLKPGDVIPKIVRIKQLGALMWILHRDQVLAPKEKPFSNSKDAAFWENGLDDAPAASDRPE